MQHYNSLKKINGNICHHPQHSLSIARPKATKIKGKWIKENVLQLVHIQ